MITQLEGRIQDIAGDLLNEVERKGSLNLVDDYSFPLPIIVISEMLGIPKKIKRNLEFGLMLSLLTETPEEIKETEKQLSEFITYLQYLVDIKRKEPKKTW